MTDKQIIIDGVDVSGCSYYDDRNGYCDACKDDIDGASFTKCMYEDNCYYKQLKRKEQECEEQLDQLKAELEQEKALKETYLACYKAKHEDIEGELFNLKAENDELKRLIAKQKNAKIQLSKLKDKQYKEFCDMKQTLTEIREIAEKIADECEIEPYGACALKAKEQILQKISECEGNDENL